MRPIERGTLFSSYHGDTVMIVGMDDAVDAHPDQALCEVEFYSRYSRAAVGTRKIMSLAELEGLHGSGASRSAVSPAVGISPTEMQTASDAVRKVAAD